MNRLVEVLFFSQKESRKSDQDQRCAYLEISSFLAQIFDAVLAVIIKLAGDNIFAKFCQDALSHILRHPRSIQTRDLVGVGWDGLVWVEMDGDGWGWVGMGVWDQLDG